MQELESQATHLRELDPDKESEIHGRKSRVEERFKKVLAPLQLRRQQLERVKKVSCHYIDYQNGSFEVEPSPNTKTDQGSVILYVVM